MDQPSEVFLELAGKDELEVPRAVEMLVSAALIPRDHPVLTCSIGGYDDDPRELWEIPETIVFLDALNRQMRAHHPAVHALIDDDFRALMRRASAIVVARSW